MDGYSHLGWLGSQYKVIISDLRNGEVRFVLDGKMKEIKELRETRQQIRQNYTMELVTTCKCYY